MNTAIDCVDLSKTYYQGLRRRPVRALKHLNLRVQQSEVFGFLGPNGAGKTTTIRLILNLLRPTDGPYSGWTRSATLLPSSGRLAICLQNCACGST